MANIDLGTFTFDAGVVDTQLESLRKEMALLRDERKKYGDQEKDYNKIIDATIKTQEELIATGKKDSAEMKTATALLGEFRKKRQEVITVTSSLAETQKKLSGEYREASKMANTLKDAEGNLVTSTEAINIALEREVKTIADARASNKELLALRNQLDIADGNNVEALAELNGALDKNNAFIKENVSAYEQQKIGIGDYQTAIENALGGVKVFGVGINDIKQQFSQFAPVLNLIKGELTSIKDSFNTAKASTEGYSNATKAMGIVTASTSGALKLLKVALISTGIGAIVVVLGSLIAYLTGTQKGIDLITKVTAPLKAIFSTLVGVLQQVGEFLISAFSDPLTVIKELYEFVKKNVIVNFQSLGKILQGLFTLDFDLMKQGFTDLENNAKKNLEIISGAAGKIGDKFEEAYKKGQLIAKLTKEQADKQLEYNAAQVKFNDLVDEQLLISKDTSKSFKERAAASEEIIRLNDENSKKETEILQIALKILDTELSMKDASLLTNEEKQKRIDLLEQIDAAEDRGLNARLEETRVLAGARKEAAAAAIAALKERQDLAIQTNQEELDLFIAQQGFKRKSDEEDLQAAKTKRDKENEILKQKLAFDRITQAEFDAQTIANNNEFLEKQRDIVISNAEKERDEVLANIADRVTDYQEYTDEKLQIDIAAIEDRLLAEQTFADQQLEQGVINQEEYDTQIAAIKAQARQDQLDQQLEFETADNERKLIDLENQRVIDQENFMTAFEVKKAQLEQQRLAEIAATESSGAAKDLINQKYALRENKLVEENAKYQAEIERQKQDAKLTQAKAVFNGLSDLLGKESVAGKAAAIAAAIINTFQGVTKALAEGGVIGIATGALVAATGAISIGKILSTKPPERTKAERGMKVPKWGGMLKGRSHKQGGINIEAEGGEAIINKRSSAMFGGLLSQINMAGGGIPLMARGGIVGSTASRNGNIQNRLMQDVNNSAMSEMVAEAVRQGSMEGSAMGSKIGSQDGLIGLSENRQVQNSSAF